MKNKLDEDDYISNLRDRLFEYESIIRGAFLDSDDWHYHPVKLDKLEQLFKEYIRYKRELVELYNTHEDK